MEENITIEFLKEWIDKYNLTKGSFDRIMNDLIYNSGHNYIDNPNLRYWLIDNTYKFRDRLPVELNDNQQVVLEWLTENIHLGTLPFNQISLLNQSFFNSPIDTSDKYLEAFGDLDSQEQYQVLAAFAEWGMSNA